MSKQVTLTPSEFSARLSFSRQEVATMLGVSFNHVRNEIKRGKLRESRSGARRLITRRELDRYLAAGEEQHEPTNAAA